MTYPFRDVAPFRSCKKKYTDYKRYKSALAKDFNHKCGYSHCSDSWFGGQRNFQIDHFKPENKYAALINEYSNLVYCCSYVNRAKWDDDNPNYLDPCDVDYNEHFLRDENGYIKAKTPQAEYMIEHLGLNLARYAICWKLDILNQRIEKLKQLNKSPNTELFEEYYTSIVR